MVSNGRVPFAGPFWNSQTTQATASAFPCHARHNGKRQLMKAFIHGLLTLLLHVGTFQGEVSLNTETKEPGECLPMSRGEVGGVADTMPHFAEGVS